MKTKITPNFSRLLLVIGFYLAGLFLIQQESGSLKNIDKIKQELVIYTDRDGEEHEDESLIEIEGIGKVLSYKDIYITTIPFLLASCVLAKVLFNSMDELRFMIYTSCILGLLLIWLTTKPNIVSTILYWCGIIAASSLTKRTTNITP